MTEQPGDEPHCQVFNNNSAAASLDIDADTATFAKVSDGPVSKCFHKFVTLHHVLFEVALRSNHLSLQVPLCCFIVILLCSSARCFVSLLTRAQRHIIVLDHHTTTEHQTCQATAAWRKALSRRLSITITAMTKQSCFKTTSSTT